MACVSTLKIFIICGWVFIFEVHITMACNEFELSNVTRCPSTEEEWREAAAEKDCSVRGCITGDYHCVPDDKGNLVEVCTQPKLFHVGVCPFYDTVGNELQWRKCSKDDNCIPGKSAYLSIYVYKYPKCFMKEESSTTRITASR
ncbi:uncharacterized protein LOC144619167 isoform X3 [Crassostrea virginica]